MVQKKKWYAVSKGRFPGVYDDRNHANKMIHGYPGGFLRVFRDKDEAWEFLNEEQRKQEAAASAVVKKSTKSDKSTDESATVDKAARTTTGNNVEAGVVIHAVNSKGENVSFRLHNTHIENGHTYFHVTKIPGPMQADANLQQADVITFPSHKTLPVGSMFEADTTYWIPSSWQKKIRRHWAFIGEAKEINRDTSNVIVVDRTGKEVLLWIDETMGLSYSSERHAEPKMVDLFEEGKAFAIMYLQKGRFDDEMGMPTLGVPKTRIKYIGPQNFKGFNMGLQELSDALPIINFYIQKQDMCHGCQEDFPNRGDLIRCDDCLIVQWCSEACQEKDSDVHSKKCPKLQDISFFYRFDWDVCEDGRKINLADKPN